MNCACTILVAACLAPAWCLRAATVDPPSASYHAIMKYLDSVPAIDTHDHNEVITEKANIELLLNDPYWEPYDLNTYYTFAANVLRLNPLIRGFHPSEFTPGRP